MQQIKTVYNTAAAQSEKDGARLLFCLLWVLLFALYFPAAKAGFVTDFTGWLDQVKNHSFLEHINRTNFQARSLYQFTQLNTYIFYKLFGIHEWPWHLLFITLHAINGCLLFKLCTRLLAGAGVTGGNTISFWGALLFCVSPYMSEAIIWEPSFHFLQGLLLILGILLWAQRFIQTGAKKYAAYALITYLLSTFSLEIFYITPWLVLTLAVFYHSLAQTDKKILRQVLLYFFLPMLLLFCLRFVAYRAVYGDWISRIGSGAVAAVQYENFGKPVKYLFHLLLLGRFFPNELRHSIYSFCDSPPCLAAFYGFLALGLGFIAVKFFNMGGKGKVASLLFVWLIISLLLLVPLAFPADLLVLYDRYLYFAGAFFYMLCAVLLAFITVAYIRLALLTLFALTNLRFAIQVSRYWGKSYRIVHSLLHNLPAERNKTIILLNIPQSMHGVHMIGAEKNSEYKLLHDLLIPDRVLTNTVYDVLAYNMQTPTDGAHVNVINDSLVKVTLNQWGTWWWFETRGAYSYWTSDYRLDLRDPGHWYELTLRKPADQYLLLYNVGDQWKTVDMSKKDVDQN